MRPLNPSFLDWSVMLRASHEPDETDGCSSRLLDPPMRATVGGAAVSVCTLRGAEPVARTSEHLLDER